MDCSPCHPIPMLLHCFLIFLLVPTVVSENVSLLSGYTSPQLFRTRTDPNSTDRNISSSVLLSDKIQMTSQESQNKPHAEPYHPIVSQQGERNRYNENVRSEVHSFTTLRDFHSQTPQEKAAREEDPPPGENYKIELQPDQTIHYPINVQKCGKYRIVTIKATSGIAYLVNNETSPVDFSQCKWAVTVAEGQFLAARFELDQENSYPGTLVRVLNGRRRIASFKSSVQRRKLIYSPDNFALFIVSFNILFADRPANATTFYLLFTSVAHDGRRILPEVMTSSTTGFITSAGFGGEAGYADHTDASYDLIVPRDHVVLISCPRFDLRNPAKTKDCSERWDDHLQLREINNDTRGPVTIICGNADFRPRVFTSSLGLRMFVLSQSQGHYGFKMEFSFHPVSDAPFVNNDGMLNCSGTNYNTFKQHVRCNLERDCAGGEDEGGHCPFSSQLCNGSVALGEKCYMSFRNEKPVSWNEANQDCKHRDGILAGMRTKEEEKAVESIFIHSRWWSPAWVGLRRTDSTVPRMYWKMWQWSNDVMEYSTDINYSGFKNFDEACTYITPQFHGVLFAFFCTSVKFKRYFCEFQPEMDRADVPENSADIAAARDLTHKKLWVKYPMIKCPSGHVTLSFLSCDPASDCGTRRHQTFCGIPYLENSNVTDTRSLDRIQSTRNTETDDIPTESVVVIRVSLFACGDGKTTLTYSLVCDYQPNCPDKSDETFCDHGDACPDHTCNSGQCFSFSQKCDKPCDCFDCSDEAYCPPTNHLDFFRDFFDPDMKDNELILSMDAVLRRQPPPTTVDFDRWGSYIQRPMQESDPCPETHFGCSRVKSHCLPIYVRCNGVYDCPNLADEEDCDRYTCPGFYRCRGSRVCVHADHMCDGWSQCPEHDDELYCGLACPSGCLCQGLAFVCSVKFAARDYPQTRYLDASESKMKPDDLFHNWYLIWLRMAFCSLTMVSGLSWPNLIHLDLSQNDMDVVSMDTFLHLINLRTLILSANPLVSLLAGAAGFSHKALNHLDLSKTMLREFNGTVLTCYPHISKLNVSHCPMDRISDAGFSSTQYLITIDLSGSPVTNFPRDLLKRLNQLETIFSANYKLCCKATLPETFDVRMCFAPQDELSSCEDLLRSNAFRGCLWMFGILAFSGNVACFLVRFFSKEKSLRSGFNVFVANLTVADFLMGVYLVIVGVADFVYLGQYVWHEISWRSSKACSVAGFLSFVSSEMSAFIICLITIDRFIVLTFPFTHVRFNGRSAAVTCGIVWAICIFVASVPFFPMTPRWEFYGQTGICIPLPITRGSFPGHKYAFGVMIVFNFVLFLLVAAGQAAIYWSVRVNSMSTADSSRKSQDLVIARRLITVAVSDFLCWFPIGLLGLLSSIGVPVISGVSVAMAIFVLPLNSAINPFLYTFNIVMERRRKAYETQLIKTLEKRILSQKNSHNMVK